MKRIVLVLTLAAAAAPALAARPASAPAQYYRPGEVLVQYRQGVDAKAALVLKNSLGMSTAASLPGARVELLALPGVMNLHQAIAALRAKAQVQYAEPNYLRFKLDFSPNDTLFAQQWGLLNTGQANFIAGGPAGNPGGDLHLTQAWDSSNSGVADRTGDGSVTVAILDDGFQVSHPDLAANFIAGYDFVHNDADPSPDSGKDHHGTEVAGTIGAIGNNAAGVASPIWSVKLMPLKFGFDLGSEINALEYALAHGAQIVNASFGGPGYSQIESDEIARLGANGILFVTAAGNENSNTDIAGAFYPANYRLPNLVPVAATNRQDDIASFSTYGPVDVDVAAPGLQIVTTALNSGYTAQPGVSGTSLATGYASGVAALIRNYAAGAGAAETRARLIEGADAGVDAASPVNLRTAGGRIDAARSLALAAGPSLVIQPQQVGSYGSTDDGGNAVTVPILQPVLVQNDSDGNGALDPGESADLKITLQNLWQDAAAVSGTLSASGGGVTVNSGALGFGDIPAQGSAAASFNIGVPATASGHQYVQFTLALTAAGGYSASRHFILELGTLANNVAVTQSIGNGLYDYFHTWHFTLAGPLPAGQDTLTFQTSAGNDIDILVGYQSPVQYAIDLGVNDNPNANPANALYYYNVADAQTGAAPGGNEYVNIPNPQPGTYYVTVIDYDQVAGAQYTLNAFTNTGGVGNFPSSTLAFQASQNNHGGGAAAPGVLAVLGGLAALRRGRRRSA